MSFYDKFFHLNEKTLLLGKNNDGIKYIQVALSVRDENTLKNIKDNYPKYLITLDYDTNDFDGIRQISAIDFLTGRTNL